MLPIDKKFDEPFESWSGVIRSCFAHVIDMGLCQVNGDFMIADWLLTNGRLRLNLRSRQFVLTVCYREAANDECAKTPFHEPLFSTLLRINIGSERLNLETIKIIKRSQQIILRLVFNEKFKNVQ